MTVHTFGPITLNLANGAVKDVNGDLVKGPNGRPLRPLTHRELRLLAILIDARGEVVLAERLALEVCGLPLRSGRAILTELVHRMRQKLPMDEDGRPLVRTMRGEGYWIAASTDPAGFGELAAEFAPARQRNRLRRVRRTYRLRLPLEQVGQTLARAGRANRRPVA